MPTEDQTRSQYKEFKRPRWAPPSWLFGPVWSVLYILIAVSFGYVAYLYTTHTISFVILLPFLLNLLFNAAYTPIQFRLHSFMLAALDILLVLGTLAWALWAIYPVAAWVALINIPYLLWVSFATILQLTITWMNRR